MKPGVFRLLLAALVVIQHSFPLKMGAWAVGMFFVLSGFWISRMWRTSYSRKPSPYRTFLVSRWWRIAPLLVVIEAIALAVSVLGFPASTPSVIGDWKWWMTQFTVVGATQFGRLLSPVWSLDVEMQFYLLAPLSIALIMYLRRTATMIVIVVGMIPWCVWRLENGVNLETAHLDIYAWLFLLGIACDLWNWDPSVLASKASFVVLIVLVVLIIANPSTRPLVWSRGSDVGSREVPGASLFFVFSTLVTLPIAIRTAHRPSSTWDRWLGDLSFPLYLFHWLPRNWYYANVDWSQGPFWTAVLLIANFAMAFGGAVVLLEFIDRPIQNMRRRHLQILELRHRESVASSGNTVVA